MSSSRSSGAGCSYDDEPEVADYLDRINSLGRGV
jgi:hypothetical protein